MTEITKIPFICLLVIILMCTQGMAQDIRAGRIWSTAQVESAISEGGTVIVDARNIPEEDYLDEHLPGAIRLNNQMLTRTNGPIPGMLLPDRQLEKVISEAGLSEESTVVVYAGGETPKDYVDAARVIAILNYSGIKNTFYMDGGIAKWDAEDRPLEEGAVKVQKTRFKIHHPKRRSIFCDLTGVKDALYGKNAAVLIDARRLDYYEGHDSDPRLARHGHIPGALDLPVTLFTQKEGDYYVLKSPAEIEEILRSHGLDPGNSRPWISYCNTGHLASGIWFISEYRLHRGMVRIYEGSMAQYARTQLALKKDMEWNRHKRLAKCDISLNS